MAPFIQDMHQKVIYNKEIALPRMNMNTGIECHNEWKIKHA